MRASVVVTLLCVACKAAPNESAPAPDAGAPPKPSVKRAPSASASAPVAAPACMPEMDAWQPYGELDAPCDFALPPSPAAFPPPIAWERCAGELGASKGCRQMSVVGFDAFDMNHRPVAGENGGRLQLLFERACQKPRRRMLVAAEADGAVLGAVASRADRQTTGCKARPVFIGGGRWVFQLVGDPDDKSETLDLAASPKELTILQRLAKGQSHEHIAASRAHWGTIDGGVNIGPFGKPADSVHAGAVSSNLAMFRSAALFVDDQSASLMAWTNARGTVALHKLERPDERVKGIAFDDDVVVWTAHAPRAKQGDECALVAAKLSLSPPRIVPKRVLTFACPRDRARPWVVGAGYAAHATNDAGVLLVRVADGTSWTVKHAGAPLFVSASELVFEIGQKGFAGIGRMPIAAIRGQ